MTRLILVRHASTTDNHNNRLSGHIDSMVSESGKIQIERLTEYLKDFSINKIYTTTSRRTKDTVEILAKIKSLNIIEKESLKEINFGEFEGLTFEEIESNYYEEFQSIIEKGYEYKYPNGESLIDSYNRVVNEIKNILKLDKDKNILICSHGGTIRNIITYLISNSYKYHWNFKIDNASVTIIDIEDGFSVINTLNNTNF